MTIQYKPALVSQGLGKGYKKLSLEETKKMIDTRMLRLLWGAVFGEEGLRTSKAFGYLHPRCFTEMFIEIWRHEGKNNGEILRRLNDYTEQDWKNELNKTRPYIESLLQFAKDNPDIMNENDLKELTTELNALNREDRIKHND